MRIHTPGNTLYTGSIFDRCLHNQRHIDKIISGKGLHAVIGYSGQEVHGIDLAKAPHVMIAGCTGSGKSVLEHTLIVSLLRVYLPTELQFVMIDPKRVELSVYRGIPHLMRPICTECSNAAHELERICQIMDKRYRVMMKKGLRDYSPEVGERIIIVIDELADLMLQYRKQVEPYLIRIAQLGRAAGIHLIVATQRPDRTVISGVLKANIPTRIALRTATAIDSRVIMDTAGAELLRGKGDAIIRTDEGMNRVQVPYITDQEIQRIVKFWTSRECRG